MLIINFCLLLVQFDYWSCWYFSLVAWPRIFMFRLQVNHIVFCPKPGAQARMTGSQINVIIWRLTTFSEIKFNDTVPVNQHFNLFIFSHHKIKVLSVSFIIIINMNVSLPLQQIWQSSHVCKYVVKYLVI